MELIRQNLLTVLIFLPLLGAAAVLVMRETKLIRATALVSTVACFLLSLLAVALFDHSRSGTYSYDLENGVVQMEQRAQWIPSINAQYLVGIDGLSLPLVVLSTLVFVLAVVASWSNTKQLRGYFSLLLLLQTGVLGSFLALDFLLFFVFFEVSLLPMYFLIGIWGGARKEYAAIKFFLYTFLGSIAILVALIAIYQLTGSMDLIELPRLLRNVAPADLPPAMAMTLFVLLLIGFLVKLPSVPLHTWLPDAHVEASTPISMILAAVLLKLGGYGLLRIAMPLFAWQAIQIWEVLATIGVVSILFGAFCALGQTDFKRLVAYSSISHMGFVLLGAAMMTPASVAGAVFMMVAHGITSAAMFFVVGVVYDRLHHRDLTRMGGLADAMPVYTRFAAIFIFASLGLPGLCGFVGEILVLMGTFAAISHGPVAGTTAPWTIYLFGSLAAFGIVLSAGYMLWTLQRVYLGKRSESEPVLAEVTTRESIVLWPLAVLAVALGVLPWPLVLIFSQGTIEALLKVFS